MKALMEMIIGLVLGSILALLSMWWYRRSLKRRLLPPKLKLYEEPDDENRVA